MYCFSLRRKSFGVPGFSSSKVLSSLVLLFNFISMPVASSDGFTGGVTPSRFELNTKSGEILRRSVDIYNLGSKPAKYRVRTVDWSYSEQGNVSFHDDLQQESCRPWVRIEQHEVEIMPAANRPRNFRFEVHVPDDAPRYECRFALMIEGVDNELVTQLGEAKNIALPINGRIAVIVYLGIDGVKSDIAINKLFVGGKKNSDLPAIEVQNHGDAHGRLESELIAKMSSGKKVELAVATSPILAKQTRSLVLKPVNNSVAVNYPMTIKGKIYSDNHTYSIDTVLDR